MIAVNTAVVTKNNAFYRQMVPMVELYLKKLKMETVFFVVQRISGTAWCC